MSFVLRLHNCVYLSSSCLSPPLLLSSSNWTNTANSLSLPKNNTVNVSWAMALQLRSYFILLLLVHHHQWRRRQLRHLLCPLMHRHCRDQMIQKKGLGGGKKARVKKQRFCWSGGCGQKWFYRDEYKKSSLGRIKTLQLGAKFYNLSLTRLRNFTYQEKNSKKCYL